MPLAAPPASTGRTVLCVRSRRADDFTDQLLHRYEACVLHDARLACRKAKLGVFDCYLAIDFRSNDAPLYFWSNIRAFDPNTPFLLVLAHPLAAGTQPAFRRGYDEVVMTPAQHVSDAVAAIARLLAHAERRSLEARSIEARAVQRDIAERLARLEHRVQLSRQSLARAQEHVMRALAIREFLKSGGTRALFERYWSDTFEHALRDSYVRRGENPADRPRAEQR